MALELHWNFLAMTGTYLDLLWLFSAIFDYLLLWEMFRNVRECLSGLWTNFRKCSESVQKSLENHNKRFYVLWIFFVIKGKLHDHLEENLYSSVEKINSF